MELFGLLNMKNLGVIFGTRPEAIKIQSVVYQLRTKYSNEITTHIVNTNQQPKLAEKTLNGFGLYSEIGRAHV